VFNRFRIYRETLSRFSCAASAAIASVKKLKASCDIVIVPMHAGAEGRSAIHVLKQIELFLGPNRGNVYRVAHAMIDAGADVVIGHGPHVPRAMKYIKINL
jgi:poly-gamma-glutamate capsule biosynthesis protein CapA/YwtB (metallophosphatase superfamily)